MKIIMQMTMGVVLASVAITGCSTIKQSVSDNSLAYTKTQKLPPLQFPADAQALTFTPLYHVPESGTNTLNLENEKGKRYEVPKPVTPVK